MSIDTTTTKIEQWGYDKGILPNPNPDAQFDKTLEEVFELKEAIEMGDRDGALDAIGDIYVTLVMQCGAWDFTIDQCIKSAYGVISKRTGKMVDGQFVKDAE